VSVRKSLHQKSPLVAAVEVGKKALRKSDRERLVEKPTRIRVVDSLDLDCAARLEQPEENRWDYLVGTSAAVAPVIAVEVHPANPGQVDTIVAKKKMAEGFLEAHLIKGMRPARWFWVATGSTTVSKNTREYRRLQLAGIDLVGSSLSLADKL